MAAARVRSGPAAGRGCVSFLLASLGLAALTTPAYAVEVATPWRFAGIGPSQTLLRIVANGGRCEAPGTPRVQETATTVRITAITVRPDQLASPCPAVIDADEVYVPLAKPLAGRQLLGASATAVTIARSERPRESSDCPQGTPSASSARPSTPRGHRSSRSSCAGPTMTGYVES